MRVLFLTSEFPFPPDSGGRIKTLSLLQYVQARADVRVLCFRRHQLSRDQESWASSTGVQALPLARGRNLVNLARSYLSGLPLSVERNRDERMREAVGRVCRETDFDAVLVDGWLMAQYLPQGFHRLKVLHEHNAEYVLWQRQAEVEGNPLRRLMVRIEERRVRHYEASLLASFDVVFSVSAADREALLRIGANPGRTRVLPNLPDPSLLQQPHLSFANAEPLVLYFGTLSWLPNLQGLQYFLRRVWPLVRRATPEARMVIAGRDGPAWLRRLARRSSGVEFQGPVEDAEALYHRARVFVEATPSGGGTKLKILNAMARGLPVVASPQAAAGIEAVPGVHLLVGDGPEALAGAIARLLTEAALWQNIAAEGRRLIRERYTAETAYAPLAEVLNASPASV